MSETDQSSPGYAAFVVNTLAISEELDQNFKRRTGCRNDLYYLTNIFVSTFGFNLLNCQRPENFTKPKFLHDGVELCTDTNNLCLMCQIRLTDHSRSKYFLLAISSHGAVVDGEQVVYFCDGQFVKVQDILDNLTDGVCPTLKGKQRVVILQVCRKTEGETDCEDFGVYEPKQDHVCMDVENSNSKNDQEMASMDVQSTEPQALYCGTDLPSPHINLNTAGGSPKSPSSVHGHDETSTDGIITMAMEFFGLTLNRGDEVIVEKSNSRLCLPPCFLVVFPTVHRRPAYHDGYGSWLMQAMDRVISEHDFTTQPVVNFFHFMTKVTNLIAYTFQTLVRKIDPETNMTVRTPRGSPIFDESKEFKSAVELQHTLREPIILWKRTREPEIPAPSGI